MLAISLPNDDRVMLAQLGTPESQASRALRFPASLGCGTDCGCKGYKTLQAGLDLHSLVVFVFHHQASRAMDQKDCAWE